VVEELVPVVASFVTTPALVNASQKIATSVFEPVVNVSVEACLFAACPTDVKQNRSEANGVVAQPLG
jgi:hypothetical protein